MLLCTLTQHLSINFYATIYMYSNTFPGENVALFTPLHLSKKTYQLVSYNTLL